MNPEGSIKHRQISPFRWGLGMRLGTRLLWLQSYQYGTEYYLVPPMNIVPPFSRPGTMTVTFIPVMNTIQGSCTNMAVWTSHPVAGVGGCTMVSVECIPGPKVVSHLALIQMLYLVGGRQWTQLCGGEGDSFVHCRGRWLITYMLHT